MDEQQLQKAILRAINSVMSDKPTLVRQVTKNLQVVIHPSRSGELTIAEIDHQLETLAQEFDAAFAAVASGNSTDYIERFRTILAQQAELKTKRAELEQRQAEDAELTSHMELAADILEQAGTAITKWDEYQIRALVESVRILSKKLSPIKKFCITIRSWGKLTPILRIYLTRKSTLCCLMEHLENRFKLVSSMRINQ